MQRKEREQRRRRRAFDVRIYARDGFLMKSHLSYGRLRYVGRTSSMNVTSASFGEKTKYLERFLLQDQRRGVGEGGEKNINAKKVKRRIEKNR